jgi:hypothetical protein
MLVQLVRETALAKGREDQANLLGPVTEKMHELVAETRKGKAVPPPAPGLMGQADFRVLLEVSKARTDEPAQGISGAQAGTSSIGSINERNTLIQAMSEASMSDIEIARQFAMTREEVRLVLSIQQKSTSLREIGS